MGIDGKDKQDVFDEYFDRENEVIIDGVNVAEERKFLIHTDKYSIGEDGLIEGEIPLTDICYDLSLQLQRLKAERDGLKSLIDFLPQKSEVEINKNKEIRKWYEEKNNPMINCKKFIKKNIAITLNTSKHLKK